MPTGIGIGLSPIFGGTILDAPIVISFDLLDRFSVTESAPMASPHACDVAGSLTLVQNDGQMSVASGALNVPAQSTPAWGDLGYYSVGAFARAQGRIFSHAFTHALTGASSIVNIGPASVGYAGVGHIGVGTGAGNWQDTGSVILTPNPNEFSPNFGERVSSLLLKNTAGQYQFERYYLTVNGRYDNTASFRHRIVGHSTPLAVEYISSAMMPAPFNTETGWSTFSGAVSAATLYDAGTVVPWFSFSWTPQADEVFQFDFRYLDANNYMRFEWTQATGAIRIYEIYGGASTTRLSATATATAGTLYNIDLRVINRYISLYIHNSASAKIRQDATVTYAFLHSTQFRSSLNISNVTVYPVELSGNALAVMNAAINPFIVGGRTRNTINVPDGANLNTYAAMLRGGDILSLYPGGTYTTPLTSLPSGYPGYYTTVQGNGATISGASGVLIGATNYIEINGLNILNSANTNMLLTRCRHFRIIDCYAATAMAALDNFKFDSCHDGYIYNCEAGPSTLIPDSVDGFELYGSCSDITFDTCSAHGCANGFEAWIAPRPAWTNIRCLVINCNSYNHRGYGYSDEGGAQELDSDFIVRNCTASNNAGADAQGKEGATLHLQNCPGFTTSGSVIVDY